MELSRIEEVRHRLERLRGQWTRVSRESGVKYKTIKNIMQERVKDPRNSNVDRLHEYLSKDAA